MYDDDKSRDLFCRPGDERALLSLSMKNIDNIFTIASKMDIDGFLYKPHRLLFALIKNLSERNLKKFDLTALINEAQGEGVLSLLGGYDYVQSIYDMIVSQINFSLYLDNVVEAYTKYSLHKCLHSHIELLEENSKAGIKSDDLVSAVENDVLELSNKSLVISEPNDLTDSLIELIDSRQNNKVIMSGKPTGYPILDKLIDGLIPGTLTTISARKKMGKSAFLTNISLYMAYVTKEPVLYIG